VESVSSFPTQKCLRRAILPSDLTRFPSYAHRIRKIQFDARSLVDVEVIQALTVATLHMRPLLPNIKHLVWHYGNIGKEVERSLLQCIYLFFAPKLATLNIFLRNTFDTTCLTIFSDLIKCCPALKDLNFLIHSFNFSENNRRGFSSVICQWNTLRSLAVIDLTQEALEHLATIPCLQRLSFTSLKGATRGCDQRLPIVTRNPAGGYPALRFLSISCSAMEVAIAFAQLLSSSPVEDLHISVVDHCYPPQWRELFNTISCHIDHISLQNLRLKETRLNLDQESEWSNLEVGLEALAVFSDLQNVNVQPSLGIMLTSDTANRLAAAWPHIERLELGNLCSSFKPLSLIIEDLVPFAKYCPKLWFLGIVFDARDIQLTSPRPSRSLFSNTLTSLSVGDSPIESPALVAAFLSGLFPSIDSITFDCDWRDPGGDPEEATDDGKMWDEVERLLKISSKVRIAMAWA
jgi:hypothetical protein